MRLPGSIAMGVLTLAACQPGAPGAEPSVTSTFRLDSLPPMLQPVTRQHRFYIDPKSGDPERTVVMALRLDRSDRFVLGQEPEDGGQLIIVADSAGRIPVFDSPDEAKAYRERYFPAAGDSSDAETAAMRVQMQEMLDGAGPIQVNLDEALAWTRDPASDRIDATKAELVWDVLTAAAVAPARLPFDPMGMYALSENQRSGEIDSTTYRIAMTGMKVSGLSAEAKRKSALAEARAPFPEDTTLWTTGDRALLVEILVRGVAGLRPRLSTGATQTDVRATWPSPSAARLSVRLMGNSTGELRLRPPSANSRPENLSRWISEFVGPPRPRGTASDAAYRRYLRDREAYIRDLHLHHRQAYKFADASGRVVPVDVEIRNEGDRRAESLMVVFQIPRGLTPVGEELRSFDHSSPDEPLPPSAYEDPARARRPYVPAQRVLDAGKDRTLPDARRNPDGSWTYERPWPGGIPAHDAAHLFGLLVQFTSWESVAPFEIGVEVRSATDTVRARLPMDVRRADP